MLNGPELGKALTEAMRLKGAKNVDVANEFRVKAPSVVEWKKKGTIAKKHIHHMIEWFSDVVGPDHWGLGDDPLYVSEPRATYNELTDKERELLNWFRWMSPEAQQAFIGHAQVWRIVSAQPAKIDAVLKGSGSAPVTTEADTS